MFDWDDYIKVSKSLVKYARVNSTIAEGFYRSGVSRAYYAAYHAALDYALTIGYNERRYRNSLRGNVRKLGQHRLLTHYLLNQSDPNTQSLGASLETCRFKRTECDYDQKVIVDKRYTVICFVETDNIHGLISSLP